MGFILDVLIPKDQNDKVGLSEVLVEWGGERFSEEVPKFLFDSTVPFRQNKDLEYFQEILGEKLDNYIALTLQGKELMDLEFLVNNKSDAIKENVLIRFLEKLLELDSFYIVLLKDEEEIDGRYQVRNRKELWEIISRSLDWKSPKGAIITK